jgi:NAD(P)H-hydrate epimerase
VNELVLSRAAVRALDRRAIEEFGIPSLVLMENAGRACAHEALRLVPESDALRENPILVLCGPGNNGGDGLVIARTLFNLGRAVRAVFVGRRARSSLGPPDFRKNLRLWRGLGQSLEIVEDAAGAAGLGPALARAALVVDALFGTGLERELDDPWRSLIRAVNACGRPVLAVDIPSGLDADTGAELGAAVKATLTVTFVAHKQGFLRGRGPEHCGQVRMAEIGIPRPWLESAAGG